ncbi:MAG: alpha/beta hydrolase [Actinomycetota bacterium]|nr:alpha/beta hydrolase [Actinomycetota bacterium]
MVTSHRSTDIQVPTWLNSTDVDGCRRTCEFRWMTCRKATSNRRHALLAAAGIDSPWVLVGHSFGGLICEVFAAEWPGETAALVFVDASDAQLFLDVGHPVIDDGEGPGTIPFDMAASVRDLAQIRESVPQRPTVVVASRPGRWLESRHLTSGSPTRSPSSTTAGRRIRLPWQNVWAATQSATSATRSAFTDSATCAQTGSRHPSKPTRPERPRSDPNRQTSFIPTPLGHSRISARPWGM